MRFVLGWGGTPKLEISDVVIDNTRITVTLRAITNKRREFMSFSYFCRESQPNIIMPTWSLLTTFNRCV